MDYSYVQDLVDIGILVKNKIVVLILMMNNNKILESWSVENSSRLWP